MKKLFLLLSLFASLPLLLGASSAINFTQVGNLGGYQGADWADCTSNGSGWSIQNQGTVANLKVFCRRVGDSLEFRGRYDSGTLVASTYSITFPTIYIMDTTKLGSSTMTIGDIKRYNGAAQYSSTANGPWPVFYDGSDSAKVYAAITASGTSLSKANGTDIGVSTNTFDFQGKVPISGWTSTTPNGVTLNSEVNVYNTSGQGSTNGDVLIFNSVSVNTGTDITYATSATLGDSFTINTSGIYAMTYCDYAGSDQNFGISKNASGTTAYASLAVANQVVGGLVKANYNTCFAWTGHLSGSDVIRPHTSGATSTGDNKIRFQIVRIQ